MLINSFDPRDIFKSNSSLKKDRYAPNADKKFFTAYCRVKCSSVCLTVLFNLKLRRLADQFLVGASILFLFRNLYQRVPRGGIQFFKVEASQYEKSGEERKMKERIATINQPYVTRIKKGYSILEFTRASIPLAYADYSTKPYFDNETDYHR